MSARRCCMQYPDISHEYLESGAAYAPCAGAGRHDPPSARRNRPYREALCFTRDGHVLANTGLPLFNRLRQADRKSTTSELQSLMRNSYAVFCLKKKKKTK